VVAHYAGAPTAEGRGESPDGAVLRVDFSERDGVTVEARQLS
jgi:hypothetical protein